MPLLSAAVRSTSKPTQWRHVIQIRQTRLPLSNPRDANMPNTWPRPSGRTRIALIYLWNSSKINRWKETYFDLPSTFLHGVQARKPVFLKHFFETKILPTFLLFLSEHAYVAWISRSYSNLHSIFRLRTLRYRYADIIRCHDVSHARTHVCIHFNFVYRYPPRNIWSCYPSSRKPWCTCCQRSPRNSRRSASLIGPAVHRVAVYVCQRM